MQRLFLSNEKILMSSDLPSSPRQLLRLFKLSKAQRSATSDPFAAAREFSTLQRAQESLKAASATIGIDFTKIEKVESTARLSEQNNLDMLGAQLNLERRRREMLREGLARSESSLDCIEAENDALQAQLEGLEGAVRQLGREKERIERVLFLS